MTTRFAKPTHLFAVLLINISVLSACSNSGVDSNNAEPVSDVEPVVQSVRLTGNSNDQPSTVGNSTASSTESLAVNSIENALASSAEGTEVGATENSVASGTEGTEVGANENSVVNVESSEQSLAATVQEPEDNQEVTTTILNAENANAVILQAFEVFTGRAYDRRLTAYPYVKQSRREQPHVNALGDHFYFDTLACDGGEKSETVYEDSPGFDGFTFYDTTYTNCSIGSEKLSGRAVLSGDTCCGHGYQKKFSDNFSVTFGSEGTMALSGTYANDQTISVEDFTYDLSFSGGALLVSNATTTMSDDTLSGSFNMSPPVLNNQSVLVSVDDIFDNFGSVSKLSYAYGSMRITAADSEIILVAHNDDANTVNVTINANGESTTRIEPWSNWFHALSFTAPTLGQDIEKPVADGDGTLLNEETFRTTLTEVFQVLNGNRFGAKMIELPGFDFPSFPYEALAGKNGYGEPINQTCDNGGFAELNPFRWGHRQETQGWHSEFSSCKKENKTFSGSMSSRYYGTYIRVSNGLTIADEHGSETFQGDFRYKHQPNRSDGGFNSYFYALENVYLDSTNNVDAFVLSDASFDYHVVVKRSSVPEGLNANIVTMSGRFSLSSDSTKQATINVLIAHPLEITMPVTNEVIGTASSEEGLIYIDAGNGNEVYVDMVTGNSETFEVRLIQAGQEIKRFTENWANWHEAVQFNFNLDE